MSRPHTYLLSDEPRRPRRRWGTALFFAAAIFAMAGSASGQPDKPDNALMTQGVRDGTIKLMVNKSLVLKTTRAYKRVSAAQPEIADVTPISPTSLLLTAKKAGNTQLVVWDDADQSQVIDVVVDFDLQALQQQLKAMFPDAKIEAVHANGTIVLRGRVSNITIAEQAAQIAAPYATKVLNFLEVAGGQQVQLQVRFAEVSRSALSSLGVNGAFVAGNAFGGSHIGQVNPTNLLPGDGASVGDTPAGQGLQLIGNQTISPAVTLYGGGQIGSVFVEGFVNALRQNNLLRILAEPNLIAISGQEASFLAGGEFPIPVAQSGAGTGGTPAITIEFREFGVRLTFVPIVLGDGRVRLKVAPEVSDLDFTTAVRFGGFLVPGLTQRKVNTTIELADGQSFAIAGLLNSNVTASKDVTPLLGDLPVLGSLFRSVRYQRRETELVVLVTPRLVEALNPGQVSQLPGEKWRYPTESDLFFQADLGGPLSGKTAPTTAPAAAASEPPRFYGPYGFHQAEPQPGK
jgi:pilus assembly protein CpaC